MAFQWLMSKINSSNGGGDNAKKNLEAKIAAQRCKN